MTEFEYEEIKSAMYEEMNYLNKNNLPLTDGSIGVESLNEDDGYAYASKGGYGNMGAYLSIKECQKKIRSFENKFRGVA